MNGIICINKPTDFTSFDVIAKMRGILKFKKLGHAGTLDPMATGVLPIFAGKAAKACDILIDTNKSYKAGFKLGVTTDTLDITGAVLTQKSVLDISKEDIIKNLKSFIGDIEQIPPMYSAVSVDGVRLYKLARQGIEIERQARPVTVYGLELLEYDESQNSGELFIDCSSGTYVRSIIHDLGEKLGCGACLTSLVRTKACGFTLSDCITLDELVQIVSQNNIDNYIIPIDRVFESLPKIELNEIQERMYKNGIKLDPARVNIPEKADKYRIYGAANNFLGTAVIINDDLKNELRVDKNLC